ncbi:MAG TPA: helical backbone metal receptor [Gemmatimonadaceae bacterium]|nr:helical backbone metal receptor [Gemmatimonadaceae bacterium]
MASGRLVTRLVVAGILHWRMSVLRSRTLRLVVSILILGAACTAGSEDGDSNGVERKAPTAEKPFVPATDDFGDSLRTGLRPARIVSLNPATTEILFALGAGNRLIGRTKYDLWPDSARLIPALGDGLRPNVEAVLGTRPDLVVLYASEDNRGAAGRLRAAGVSTLSIKIDSIAEFRRGVHMLGAVLGDQGRARSVVDSVDRTLARVRAATAGLSKPTVFWHVWDAPLITIGAGSFMNELVEIAGGRNVYADLPAPSPTVSLEDVSKRNPDFILAGPIGAAQLAADPRWRIVAASRAGRVLTVDTLLVARPSVRLGEAALSLANLLHPGVIR